MYAPLRRLQTESRLLNSLRSKESLATARDAWLWAPSQVALTEASRRKAEVSESPGPAQAVSTFAGAQPSGTSRAHMSPGVRQPYKLRRQATMPSSSRATWLFAQTDRALWAPRPSTSPAAAGGGGSADDGPLQPAGAADGPDAVALLESPVSGGGVSSATSRRGHARCRLGPEGAAVAVMAYEAAEDAVRHLVMDVLVFCEPKRPRMVNEKYIRKVGDRAIAVRHIISARPRGATALELQLSTRSGKPLCLTLPSKDVRDHVVDGFRVLLRRGSSAESVIEVLESLFCGYAVLTEDAAPRILWADAGGPVAKLKSHLAASLTAARASGKASPKPFASPSGVVSICRKDAVKAIFRGEPFGLLIRLDPASALAAHEPVPVTATAAAATATTTTATATAAEAAAPPERPHPDGGANGVVVGEASGGTGAAVPAPAQSVPEVTSATAGPRSVPVVCVVSEVKAWSPASGVFRPGDVLFSVDGLAVDGLSGRVVKAIIRNAARVASAQNTVTIVARRSGARPVEAGVAVSPIDTGGVRSVTPPLVSVWRTRDAERGEPQRRSRTASPPRVRQSSSDYE